MDFLEISGVGVDIHTLQVKISLNFRTGSAERDGVHSGQRVY